MAVEGQLHSVINNLDMRGAWSHFHLGRLTMISSVEDLKWNKPIDIKPLPFHLKDVDNLNKNEQNGKNLKETSNAKYKVKNQKI